MKKRIVSVLLCVCLLLTSTAFGSSAMPAEVSATKLPYTLSYGTTDGKTLSELTAVSDDQLTAYTNGDTFTLNSSTQIPCQVFEVDAGGAADSMLLTTKVAATKNERVAMKVFNPSADAWDTVATVTDNGTLEAEVATADYAADGKIRVMVTLDFVANGSNRLIWSTDQQHYTQHDDLNEFYYKIHEYMVEEYQKDNVCYVINTGDIVDDIPTYPNAAAQWKVASDAFAILDEAGVPYGIETGNHDVGDYPINVYYQYLNNFSAKRYEGKPWYGGTVDDNMCHYDLVTVGDYDFLFLYIGYGLGDDPDVINWANDVLASYPHRNAVICTHQYLKPTTLEQSGRAELIHNTIVTQNENVKMILSGHYDGAGYKWRDAEGRQVLEVVADYQFVQAESEEYYADHADPLHKIGSVAYCNGEGYLREIIIEGNTVSMYAFSPVTGGVTPFGARDDLTFTVELQKAQRTVSTQGFVAAALGSGSDNLVVPEGEEIVISCDNPAMSALIETASAVDKELYTRDSYKAMKTALKAAKSALKKNDGVYDAYFELSRTYGALEEKVDAMDRENLETVLDLNLNLAMWKNTTNPESLDKARSAITAEQLENGGFSATKSPFASNGWPAMKYVDPITFTPKDGKVYLYLDLEAGSTWSIYPTIIQDMEQYSGRLNYVIEGSYRNDLDAGCGQYVGVYDITQGLIDMGVDPTKEMTITFQMNIVPGPVTVNEISILTGEYSDPFTFGDFWQMIADFFADLFGF